MTTTATFEPPAPPDLITEMRRAVISMARFGMEMLARIQGAVSVGNTEYLPKRVAADPARAERRINRAMCWIIALSRTLVGDRLYLSQPRPVPLPHIPSTQTPATPTKHRLRPALNPDATQLKNMRRSFARHPIGHILKRLCRQMGIRTDSDYFPASLIDIAETPAEWCRRLHASGTLDTPEQKPATEIQPAPTQPATNAAPLIDPAYLDRPPPPH